MNYVSRFLLIIALIANVASYGMYIVRQGTQTVRRGATAPIQAPIQQAQRPTFAQQILPSAVYNWWYGQQQQPTQMRSAALEETTALKPGQPLIHKREFRTSVIPQEPKSWWERLFGGSTTPEPTSTAQTETSPVPEAVESKALPIASNEEPVEFATTQTAIATVQLPMTAPELAKEVDQYLFKTATDQEITAASAQSSRQYKKPANIFPNAKMPFSTKEDLENIKQLLLKNKNIINDFVRDDASFYNFIVIPDRRTPIKKFPILQSTILDRILCHILAGNATNMEFWRVSEKVMDHVLLAQWMIDTLGAIINEENAPYYENAYVNYILPAESEARDAVLMKRALPQTLHAFEIMQEAIPIIENVLSHFIPSMRPLIENIQRNRATMKASTELYAERLKEKRIKEEYLKEKSQYLEIKWKDAHGWWGKADFLQFGHNWTNPTFNENEYQQWLQSGKSFETFAKNDPDSRKKTQYMFSDPKYMLCTFIGLNPEDNPSDTEIEKAYNTTRQTMLSIMDFPEEGGSIIGIKKGFEKQFNQLEAAHMQWITELETNKLKKTRAATTNFANE